MQGLPKGNPEGTRTSPASKSVPAVPAARLCVTASESRSGSLLVARAYARRRRKSSEVAVLRQSVLKGREWSRPLYSIELGFAVEGSPKKSWDGAILRASRGG